MTPTRIDRPADRDGGSVARELILQTERLMLTTWLTIDVDELYTVHSDAATMRYVRHGRSETYAETAALVDKYIAEHAASGVTKWRLTDHADRLVGRAGFGTRDDGRELGYTLRRDRWGRGLATEIAAALVDRHRTHAADIRLYAYVAFENPASRRVLRKVGFTLVRSEFHSGMPCDLFELGS